MGALRTKNRVGLRGQDLPTGIAHGYRLIVVSVGKMLSLKMKPDVLTEHSEHMHQTTK